MSYDYFVASLPLLTIRGAAPLSSEEYAVRLDDHIAPPTAALLKESGLFAAHRALLDESGVATPPLAAQSPAPNGAMAAEDGERDGGQAQSSAAVEAAITEWQHFDRGLRAETARLRAATLKVEADPHWPRLGSLIYIDELRRIFQQTDPMVRELHLHDLRWEFLETLDQRHGQAAHIVTYYIKLQMLERLQAMQSKSAHEELTTIYERCQAQLEESTV